MLLSLVVALGCAPRGPQLPPLTPGNEGGRTVARILAEQPCLPDLRSDLDLLLQLPDERPVRLLGEVRAVWPGRFRIQARLGHFWPVASIALDSDSAYVSFPRLKGYWAGETTGLSGTTPVALAATLLWLLCPSPIVADLGDPTLDRTDDGWVLRGRAREVDPPVWIELHLPRNRGRIESILLRDRDGGILLHADRSGWRSVDGVTLPGLVRLRAGIPQVLLQVRLLRPRRDPDAPPDAFRIRQPPGTRWIVERELLEMLGASGRAP